MGNGGPRRKRRKSRPIIQGHLERVSSAVLEDYREQITELIQSNHGIYVLYRHDKLYYVGLATNLKRRINQHLRDRHRGRWDRFSLYIIRKEDHIRELECLLLRIACPQGNNIQGRLRRSKDLRPVLKRVVKSKIKETFDEMFGIFRPRKPLKKKRKRLKTSNLQGTCPLKGLLKRNQVIQAEHKGNTYRAIVRSSGVIRFDGTLYNSPTMAAVSITNRHTNGWMFWKYQDASGDWQKINMLRK